MKEKGGRVLRFSLAEKRMKPQSLTGWKKTGRPAPKKESSGSDRQKAKKGGPRAPDKPFVARGKKQFFRKKKEEGILVR